jgi:hypothetical protein
MIGRERTDENCRARAMARSCEAGFEHAIASYKFGDGVKQVGHNLKSRAKETVLHAAVKEQKRLGKFERLKGYVEAVRERWHEPNLNASLMRWQLVSAAALSVITYAGVFSVVWHHRGFRASSALATLQAASNALTLVLAEGLVVLAIRAAAVRLKVHSELVRSFALEILRIDLDELEIDLHGVAGVLQRTANGLLTRRIGPMAVLALCVWVQMTRLYALGGWGG